jgi:hypothetical protein
VCLRTATARLCDNAQRGVCDNQPAGQQSADNIKATAAAATAAAAHLPPLPVVQPLDPTEVLEAAGGINELRQQVMVHQPEVKVQVCLRRPHTLSHQHTTAVHPAEQQGPMQGVARGTAEQEREGRGRVATKIPPVPSTTLQGSR